MKENTKKMVKDIARKVVNYRCCNWNAAQFEQMQQAKGEMECNLCIENESMNAGLKENQRK